MVSDFGSNYIEDYALSDDDDFDYGEETTATLNGYSPVLMLGTDEHNSRRTSNNS